MSCCKLFKENAHLVGDIKKYSDISPSLYTVKNKTNIVIKKQGKTCLLEEIGTEREGGEYLAGKEAGQLFQKEFSLLLG